jgi:tetratricopeptide (TPR) repeat protein
MSTFAESSETIKLAVNENTRRLRLVIALLLGLSTLALYWQTQASEFLSFDDHLYITPEVRQGLSWDGLKWAFSYPVVGCPHALTYVSLMIDSTIFGAAPASYLLTNVLLHAASSVLLYLLLSSVTASTWRSFVVAAIFAWHPTHAESVAWISERKDVLSVFFALLTIAGYCHWIRKGSRRRYWLFVLLPFSLAILSKPSVVTLPAVLCLLDFWPLDRFKTFTGDHQSFSQVLVNATRTLIRSLPDKIPLLVIALIYSALTIQLTASVEGVDNWIALRPVDRIVYCIESYCYYLGKFFVPTDLSAMNIHPAALPPWFTTVLKCALLLSISLFALVRICNMPSLLVGWLWFVGTLVPVSGLFQNGSQLTANRYTYFPYIGLSIALFFGSRFLSKLSRRAACACVASWLAWLYFLSCTTAIPVWRDTESLWRSSLNSDPTNEKVLSALAAALIMKGKIGEALPYSRDALFYSSTGDEPTPAMVWRLISSQEKAARQYAEVLALTGRHEELFRICRTFSDLNLRDSVRLSSARYFLRHNRFAEAEVVLSVQRGPNARLTALYHAAVLRQLGRNADAAAEFQRLLTTKPDDALALSQLSATLALQAREENRSELGDQAIRHAIEAVKMSADAADDVRLSSAIALSYSLAVQGNIADAQHVMSGIANSAATPESLRPWASAWSNELKANPPDFPEFLTVRGGQFSAPKSPDAESRP